VIGMNFIKEDMQKREINIEYTKLIAEFLGAWVEDDFIAFEFPVDSGSYDGVNIEDLKYHLSYDWLMPAIEKYNKQYDINLLYSKNCFNVYNLYKSLGSQLTLRKNHEALETTN